MAQAVTTINTANTFSTLAYWKSRSLVLSPRIRLMYMWPASAMVPPINTDRVPLWMALRSTPMCLIPLSRVTREMKKPDRKMKNGAYRRAAASGLSRSRIRRCTLMNSSSPITPARTGLMNQLITILPSWGHCTAFIPSAATAKPVTAPTIEWVVETGQPYFEAISSQVPAASSDASMPNTSRSGVAANRLASTMPLRMVEVTPPPASTAPENSKMAAMITACRIVIDLDPTAGAMALATSLAPIPQAMNSPNSAASRMNRTANSICPSVSVRDQQVQAPADPLREIAEIAGPVQNLVQKHHIHRRQILFDPEQLGPERDLLAVGLAFDAAEFLGHTHHQFHLAAAKAGLEQFIQLGDRLLRLGNGPETAAQELQVFIGERCRRLHLAADHQARNVLGLVGDAVLVGDQVEQVGTADRHEHALGQVETEFLLQIVGGVFEPCNAFARLGCCRPIPGDDCPEEWDELHGACGRLLEMLLDRLDR